MTDDVQLCLSEHLVERLIKDARSAGLNTEAQTILDAARRGPVIVIGVKKAEVKGILKLADNAECEAAEEIRMQVKNALA